MTFNERPISRKFVNSIQGVSIYLSKLTKKKIGFIKNDFIVFESVRSPP